MPLGEKADDCDKQELETVEVVSSEGRDQEQEVTVQPQVEENLVNTVVVEEKDSGFCVTPRCLHPSLRGRGYSSIWRGLPWTIIMSLGEIMLRRLMHGGAIGLRTTYGFGDQGRGGVALSGGASIDINGGASSSISKSISEQLAQLVPVPAAVLLALMVAARGKMLVAYLRLAPFMSSSRG
ncbi:hypothetical protein AXG93_267s1110 [Marchantia polymorpha subsp. ruderalis]|uniref:Uncharacterized protein n=1 Tax=Marchantia polymorpha subsp. ruderalis TaxID=1480154 RepID=A0A176VL00_MARPO|nr:hypothetical protein AXG93_267s1110 [Marchantia polymorpha subsp. ruderalis]